MSGRIRSLRGRLTLSVVTIFAVVFVLLGLLTVRVRSGDLWRSLDARLEDRVAALAEEVRVADGRVVFDDAGRGRPLRYPGTFLQIVSTDGDVLARSENLGRHTLPLPDGLADESQTTMLRGPAAREILQVRGELRVRTQRCAGDGAAFFVQAATSTAATRASLNQLRTTVSLLALVGVVLVGATTWLVAGRTLAPLSDLSRAAAAYSPEEGWREVSPAGQCDEVAALAGGLNRLGARVERTLAAQRRFVSDASHELKTPLTVVLTQAQVLRQQPRRPAEYVGFLETVEDELAQLVYLTESLLTLARAEAGAPLDPRPIAINEVVMDALENTAPAAREAGVRLLPSLLLPADGATETRVAGDPQLLRVLVENLLRNAVRHAPAGTAVEVEVRAGGDAVELLVRDHGGGLSDEETTRIFEPFYRGADAERRGAGAGIGLALVDAIVRLHGGRVRAATHPQGGAVFTVSLPRG